MQKQHIFTLTLLVIIMALVGVVLLTAPKSEAQDSSVDIGQPYKQLNSGVSNTITIEQNL